MKTISDFELNLAAAMLDKAIITIRPANHPAPILIYQTHCNEAEHAIVGTYRPTHDHDLMIRLAMKYKIHMNPIDGNLWQCSDGKGHYENTYSDASLNRAVCLVLHHMISATLGDLANRFRKTLEIWESADA